MARIWPDILPTPSHPGFGLSPADTAARTDMESGAKKARRTSFARRDLVDVSYIFTEAEFTHFRAFWDDEFWSLSGDSDSLVPFTLSGATLSADAVVGPLNVLADRLVETAVNAVHHTQLTFGAEAVAGGTILCRATLKSSSRFARVQFTARDGTACHATIDLSSGLLVGTANVLSATVVDRGGGWWRVTITAAVATGGTLPKWRVQIMQSATTGSYLGDGASSVDVCEQQVRMVTGYDEFLRTDAAGYIQGTAAATAWAQMPLAVGGGFRYLEAQFTGPFKGGAGAGLEWSVTAQLEVRFA